MKKSIQININARIYNIDEDAYTLLNNYLRELRLAFGDDDGQEIVDDIEARIGEIFASRTSDIIVIDDVNEVIRRMGRPEQLSDGYTPHDEAEIEEDVRTDNRQEPPAYQPEAENVDSTADYGNRQRKFYRSTTNRVFGGVLGGLATYMNWNATVLRILVVLFALCTYVMPCIIVYLVMWMVVPEARTARQRLEQVGGDVTLSTIGNRVIEESTPINDDSQTSAWNVIGKCLAGVMGVIAVIVAVIVLVGAVSCCTQSVIFDPSVYQWAVSPRAFTLGALGCVAVFIPAVVVCWLAAHVLFNVKGPRPWLWITTAIVELAIIVVFTVLATDYALSLSKNL